MQSRDTCSTVNQQQSLQQLQQVANRKTKAREQILKLYAYEKKLSVKNRKRHKCNKPVKTKKGTLITRFRRRPQRSILVDFLLLVAGLVLVVLLLYYWMS
ncbi:hypothetical protein HPB50_009124 [Hyalomma asiaticum]|uniref:Uncharacterized protein n=1 Tax=Hyalomma asiaticum TaxID=266040 RepID=A0ACB7T0F9_HYAAI|nr:hypothetical protein HPB50_009124 [Hyalomma asiaticum]